MRFAFSEQQIELRSTVRQVLERECAATDLRTTATDGAGGNHRWAVLAELGAIGLAVPESLGGLGLGPVDLIGLLEEAGWFDLPEPLAENAGLVAPLLGELAATPSGSLVEEWLAVIVGGEVRAALGGVAVTAAGLVPSANANKSGLCTPRVNGAPGAGVFVLCAAAADGWELHLVAREATTVTRTPSLDPTRELGSVEWVPTADTELARGTRGAELVGNLADRAAAYSAAQLLGLGDRMITMAADYAKERQQFGKPIGSFQAVKHLLANARVKVEFARPAVYRAAHSIETEAASRSHDASMAKALAADAADLAARTALQVHGAIGYTWDCDLHFWMKRAWALSADWGDAGSHRALVLAAAIANTAH